MPHRRDDQLSSVGRGGGRCARADFGAASQSPSLEQVQVSRYQVVPQVGGRRDVVALWRRELDEPGVEAVLGGFGRRRIVRRSPKRLHREAFGIAGELGWAKTYDAEFPALAKIEGGVVLTTEARLRRGADRTGLAIDPSEL